MIGMEKAIHEKDAPRCHALPLLWAEEPLLPGGSRQSSIQLPAASRRMIVSAFSAGPTGAAAHVDERLANSFAESSYE
jgi:hypothetical protein